MNLQELLKKAPDAVKQTSPLQEYDLNYLVSNIGHYETSYRRNFLLMQQEDVVKFLDDGLAFVDKLPRRKISLEDSNKLIKLDNELNFILQQSYINKNWTFQEKLNAFSTVIYNKIIIKWKNQLMRNNAYFRPPETTLLIQDRLRKYRNRASYQLKTIVTLLIRQSYDNDTTGGLKELRDLVLKHQDFLDEMRMLISGTDNLDITKLEEFTNEFMELYNNIEKFVDMLRQMGYSNEGPFDTL